MSPATSAVLEERSARAHAGTLGIDISPRPQRRRERLDITLMELDPRDVVDGVLLENGMFLAPDPTPVGAMREVCPHCEGVALQLVLRRHHVKRTHLLCAQCTRCYDAVCEGGYSILGIV
ncbi:hypothetical protein [Herbaspirillum rhizosphaerae]|uniref:hypothetical protein n=1 Tax=Herbaspirillum rhizosphaerae TaxID=346179 RepID=UPI0009F84B03|nr:hypothetical protein [Herbaspirillum rhizosphaerae]